MSEIEILPADEPVKLNWKMKEYIGTEVYGSEVDLKDRKPLTSWPMDGAHVLVYGIGGYRWARIDEDKYGGFHAQCGRFIFPLQLCGDDRQCLITVGQINPNCIDKLKLHGKETNNE